MQGLDGNFYGTTFFGGAESAGIAFRITPAGVYTVLDSFPATGALDSPTAGASALEQFGFLTLVGATRRGGTSSAGSLYLLR